MKNALFICIATFIMATQIQANTQIVSFDFDPICDLFGKRVTLSAGTPVLLETAERFSTDQITPGKEIMFRVRMNVMAEKEVAIVTGALAIGRIKEVKPSSYNNPAEVTIELQYVQAVDGQMVALSSNEQTLRGLFTGEGTAVESGTTISSRVLNDIEIKVK